MERQRSQWCQSIAETHLCFTDLPVIRYSRSNAPADVAPRSFYDRFGPAGLAVAERAGAMDAASAEAIETQARRAACLDSSTVERKAGECHVRLAIEQCGLTLYI